MTEQDWLASEDPRRLLLLQRGKASVRKFRLFAAACCRRIWPIYQGKLPCRGVVLAERLADGMPIEENLSEVRERLYGEGFGYIDGYREERENNIRSNLAFASYEALQDGQEFAEGRSRQAAMENLLARRQGQRLPIGIDQLRDYYDATTHSLLSRVIAPDMTEAWVRAAWAMAHWKRRNDLTPVRPEDHNREAKEQLPYAHDVFGNPFRPVVFSSEWRTTTAVQLAKGMYDSRDFSTMPILADALEDAGCENEDVLNHCRDANQVHVRGCWVVDLVLGKT